MNLVYDEQTRNHTLDGLPIPSVSQIIAACGFTDSLKLIPKDIMDRAIAFGNAGHKMVEYDVQNNLDVAALPEAMKPYYFQWQLWREKYKPEIIATERPMASPKYRFCGRPDLIVKIAGELAIPDLKFTTATYAYQQLQTAGYELLANENGFKGRIRRMIVRIAADKYEVVEHKDKNDRAYFLNCLSVWNFKNKHKLLKKDLTEQDLSGTI